MAVFPIIYIFYILNKAMGISFCLYLIPGINGIMSLTSGPIQFAILANIVKIAIMAVMARISVFMGVFLKYSKNADHWSKRCLKIFM